MNDFSKTVPIFARPERAAAMLDVSRSTVFRMLASGELPSVKIGKSRRIPVAAIEAIAGSAAIQPGGGK